MGKVVPALDVGGLSGSRFAQLIGKHGKRKKVAPQALGHVSFLHLAGAQRQGVSVAVIAGGQAVGLTECLGQGFAVGKACLGCDLGDGVVGAQQLGSGGFGAHLGKVGQKSHADFFVEQLGKALRRKISHCGHVGQGQPLLVVVVEVKQHIFQLRYSGNRRKQAGGFCRRGAVIPPQDVEQAEQQGEKLRFFLFHGQEQHLGQDALDLVIPLLLLIVC